MEAGLVLGKGGRPKKATTVATNVGRIRRHIIPLLGTRRVEDVTKPDMNNLMEDIIAGKTSVVMKTEKLRGKPIVRGGHRGRDHRPEPDARPQEAAIQAPRPPIE